MANFVSVSTSNRTRRSFTNKTWERYMPDARPQRTHLLPRTGRFRQDTDWAGSCCVQAVSETMTARLRLWHEERARQHPGLHYEENAFKVDLRALIHCAAGHCVLNRDGSSAYNVGRLGRLCGIPLKGKIPYADQRPPPVKHHPTYALGTFLTPYGAIPLPSTPTPHQIEASMLYREHPCACLDEGPVVVFLRAQPHYFRPGRPANEPYRRRNYSIGEMVHYGLSSEEVRGAGHCVSVYGYRCPTGDVRSLVLKYQENALKEREKGAAATGGLDDKHIMDPDAIEFYYVPDLDSLRFSSTPGKARLIHDKPKPSLLDEITTSLLDDINNFMG